MTAEQTLAALGFTDTEALVYCELLRASPSTGYRLAQAIGKAPANTYQALSALSHKGAVLMDDSAGKNFRAVPPAELLAALKRGFAERATAAAGALERLHAPAEDDRIYQLSAAPQVLERARAMIDGAGEILLFDLFPPLFERLRPQLEAAHARGVTVAGLTYADHGETPFPCVREHSADFSVLRWPGLQLTLVADAGQHLVALLSADESQVLRGVWSDSAYLSCLQHSGLASEIRLSAMTAGAAGDDRLAHLSLLRTYPDGLRRLVGPQESTSSPKSRQGDAA